MRLCTPYVAQVCAGVNVQAKPQGADVPKRACKEVERSVLVKMFVRVEVCMRTLTTLRVCPWEAL